MSKKFDRFFPSKENLDVNQFPFYWISQVHNQYVQNIDNILKKYGLDNSRRRILLALKITPHASVSDLSDELISKMSTTTKIVYRLRDEGLVETYPCSNDGRITRVLLTDKGLDMVDKINDVTTIVLEKSFDGMTPLQIDKSLDVLKTIFHNLAK